MSKFFGSPGAFMLVEASYPSATERKFVVFGSVEFPQWDTNRALRRMERRRALFSLGSALSVAGIRGVRFHRRRRRHGRLVFDPT